MDAQNNKTQKKDENIDVEHNRSVSSDKPVIKKLRTFEEDLRDAKKRAGITDTDEEKSWILGRKKEKKIKFGKPKLIKKLESIKIPKKVDTLDKKRIEIELSKSGLIPEEKKVEDLSVQAEKKSSSVSKIHTYKTDAVESIQDKNLSVVSIAAAAEKKRVEKNIKKEDEKPYLLKNIVLSIVSVVLVASGAGVGWYFYTKSEELSGVKQQQIIPSLIFSDTQKEIDISGLNGEILLDDLRQNLQQTRGAVNTVVHFYLTESKLGQSLEVDVHDLLSRINNNIPGRLIRSLSSDFMFGVFVSQKNTPFIILKTNSFENAFAGMLDWEKTMNEDLAPLFGSDFNGDISFRAFNDVIVKNKDTRILRNDDGEVILMYSFTDAKTIIITTNESVFFEIFRRISTSNT